MKTTGDILDKLYPALNVSSVTNTITGRVYRRKKPLNSQLEDIEIVILPIDNGEGYDTQHATAIINAYAKNHDNGQPNETRLKAMAAAIIAAIEALAVTGMYFETQIETESIMQDPDDPLMSYESLRVYCTIES